MQRKSMQAAHIWIASFALGAAACASEVMPDAGGPARGGGGAGGASEGGTSPNAAGNGGGGATAGGMSNQAGLGGADAGTGNGGSGAEPPIGGEGGAVTTGGMAGSGGASGAAGTGTGGAGGGASGGGGKAGASGAGGAGGTAGASGAGGGGAGSVNLIQNGAFEMNTSGWSIFGGGTATISTATAQSHSGARSLMITGRTQAYQGPQYSVLSVITPGESYTLSVWGRLSSTTPTGSLTVTVYYACNGGASDGDNYFRWVETTEASASSWTQLTAAQVFPACAGAGTMTAASLYVESPTATLAYYIDDVTLTTP